MIALLYTQQEFAALRRMPEPMRDADYVGVWLDGRVKLIKGASDPPTFAVTITWEQWRELLEKEEAHGP